MDKDTPLARGIRTFIITLAGFAATWSTINWATDWKAGANMLVLNVVSALLAGGAAYFLAAKTEFSSDTFWGKAAYQFTVALSELTSVAVVDFLRALTTVLVGAAFSALAAAGMNWGEDREPGPPPPQ
jgi:signal transduction histidine kinase